MEEKRKFRRVPLTAVVRAHAAGQPCSVEGRNISVGGMLVKAEKTVEEGVELRLEFQLPGDPAPIHATGVVQHVMPDAFMGIRFTSLSDADRKRIEAYVGSSA
ncbi:MAG TPA: PilZ domain-containing protein [Candidatus Acidoferrales bacterium]|nr:PilZ domain-containing protein [Candidatus Acidoferrales bacterium]